MIKDENSYITE